ncbi:hypothetical protein WM40_21835 [Robbsia andropogonis]|uniref:Amidohydrolase-related domain-containing protein n=2 Tax=Robbsia andropogonis TaxID=28092 RepID=A0A0F5JUX7_9BURK|nr:hypothetical protein [Robbsia andropogonis]KKB61653.1 hypothetical protein WM40_21835 [Robbsia andropogonis]MCP1120798.1 hypothetical protein [Robbsia andropogonis]MCP1130591.1 hypothetical protein [Robbsia andropogonis]
MQMVLENLRDDAGLLGERRVFNVPKWRDADTRIVDAREWRAYPALYDADTLLTLRGGHLSEADREIALAGGVANLNASIAWQRMADPADAAALLRSAQDADMPRIRLLLSAMPDCDNTGFVDWFAAFARVPPPSVLAACKLYGRDATFNSNLEAVWRANWLPMVYTDDPERVVERAVAMGKPVVIRHATHPDAISRLRAIAGTAATDDALIVLACAPHYLLPMTASLRGTFNVRPPLLDDARCIALQGCFDDIDLIATDHVAEGATRGPGLQSQHRFLPALLSLAKRMNVPTERVLRKASRRPAALFGPDVNDWAVALVARVPVQPSMAEGNAFPGINPRHDPYVDIAFEDRVVAMVRGLTLWPTRHLLPAI